MRKLLRKIFFKLYRPYALWKISKDNTHRYGSIEVRVPKGIFHPGLFFSTEFLLEELLSLSLQNKTLLELGCGSGLIAVATSKAGAVVTAVDINKKAVATTAENAAQNNTAVQVLHSDLFSSLTGRSFDIIAINPPYYKKATTGNSSVAWFAGEEYEYFQKLFRQLSSHIHPNSIILMVVSEDVGTATIKNIAAANNITLTLKRSKVIFFELNYIYSIGINNK